MSLKTACIIATGNKGGRFLFKVRDRAYKPELEVVHEEIDGTEVCYLHDIGTDWSEGLNEHGIGIVNTALMVGRDEAEKKIVKEVGKKSKDGERIRQALSKKTLKETLDAACKFKGGILGHTFVSDATTVHSVEATSKHECVTKEVAADRVHVRTNHGFSYQDAGYTEGEDYLSSVYRRNKAIELIRATEKPEDLPAAFLAAKKDGPKSVLRKTEKMTSSSQMVLDLKTKRFLLFVLDGEATFKGVKNKLPGKRKPKIKVEIKHLKESKKEAGQFEAPPVMLDAVRKWAFKAYCSNILHGVMEVVEGLKDALAPAKKVLKEMESAYASLQRDVDKLKPGQSFRIPLYKTTRKGGVLVVQQFWTLGIKVNDEAYFQNGNINFPSDKGWKTVPSDADPIYHFAESKKRISFKTSWYDSREDAIEKVKRPLGTAIIKIRRNVAFLEGRDNSASDPKFVEYHLLRRELLKHTDAPKKYNSRSTKKFAIDVSGWKYVRPGSFVIDRANKEAEKFNNKLKARIKHAEEALKLAQNWAKWWHKNEAALKAGEGPKYHQEEQEAGQMVRELDHREHPPYWDYNRTWDTLAKGKTPQGVMIADPTKFDEYSSIWVEPSAVPFRPKLGPKQITEALHAIHWKEIECTVDFKGSKKVDGYWRKWDRKLIIFTSQWPVRTVAGLKMQLAELDSTIRHELQHVGQDLIGYMTGTNEGGGLPARKIRDPRYSPDGDRVQKGPKKDLPHALRDVEFYTRLADEVASFVRDLPSVERAKWPQAAEQWVTTKRHFFKELKKYQRLKWKKAVAEFYKEVEKQVGSLNRKLAARPIPVDKQRLRQLAKDIARQLPKHLRFREPQDKLYYQRGYSPTKWGFRAGVYETTDVMGNKVVVPVELRSRGKGLDWRTPSRQWIVGGKVHHFGYKGDIAQKYKMTVVLDAYKTIEAILANLPKVEAEVYSVLIHEATHLGDILRSRDKSQDSDESYMNDPTEVRAFMQQVADEIIHYANKVGPDSWAKMGMWVFDAALDKSTTWNRVRRHLNPLSKKTLLKGVWTALEDEMPKLERLYPGEDDDNPRKIAAAYYLRWSKL